MPSVAWFINKVDGITLSDFSYTRPRQGLCVMYTYDGLRHEVRRPRLIE